MAYLEGEHIEIRPDILKALIGTKVIYLLERDIDKTGRGYFFPRSGKISEVFNKQLGFEDGNFEKLNTIREIITFKPQTK